MARIRSIHPGIASDEVYMSMSMTAKAAWPILWTECDDHGVFEWKPIVLKARIFPADNVVFDRVLTEYIDLGCIQRCDVGGKPYGFIRNFCRFQRPKNPSYRYVVPPSLREYVGMVEAEGDSPPPGLPQPTPSPTEKPPQMKEEGGRREEEEDAAAATRNPPNGLSPFEAECRHLLEPEPVMLAQDFHVVTALFETGITEDDVRTGLREALTKRADPRQRFRSWTQLVGWCRTAAKNRLAAGPQAGARQAVPNGEPQVSLGSVVWPETSVRKAVQRFRIDPSSWPLIIGDPPGSPGCLVPERLLIGAAA